MAFVKYDEPMLKHTSFKTGGPADVYIKPSKKEFLSRLPEILKAAEKENNPVFIIGGGSNLLVSDKGIRGIVLDTQNYSGVSINYTGQGTAEVKVLAGSSTNKTVKHLAAKKITGMEFLSGLPGTIGGALWMNARCYDKSVSDILIETEILDENFQIRKIPFRAEDFSYKKSPFQEKKWIILSALFNLQTGNFREIRREVKRIYRDRKEKGHFRYPSAGSVFKNNRSFGSPTGKIIDELGLRGLSTGGAAIAPWHGNIIINKGNATSAEIKNLITQTADKVRQERGIELESEIIFAGEW